MSEAGEAKPVLVTDVPLWGDCPWKDLVPAGWEIRLGQVNDVWVMIVHWPDKGLRIDCDYASLDMTSIDKTMEVLVSNIVGTQFDKEYPGWFSKVVEAKFFGDRGLPVPASLAPAVARLTELDAMIPRALPDSPGAVSPVQSMN